MTHLTQPVDGLLTALKYLIVTLWGWPGVLLGVLAAVDVLQHLLRRCVVRPLWLRMSAAAILAAGVFMTWFYLSIPDARDFASLNDLMDARRIDKESDQGLASIIAQLRWELAQQSRSRHPRD